VKRAAHDAEAIVLAMVAALPLYFNAAIDLPSVVIFHVVMTTILVAEIRHPGFDVPRLLLRAAAVGYFFFYFVDSTTLSRSLIKGTAHLLFFIAAYQALDRAESRRVHRRLLVTFLIAVASIATSTHITIVVFVLLFALLVYRQLIAINRSETLDLAGMKDDGIPPSRNAAAAYVVPMVLIAALLFPLLPRVRDPFVRGITGPLQTATGFTEVIDFSNARTVTDDPRVVARVSMSPLALQLLGPVRLRGGHYDSHVDDRWVASPLEASRQFIRRDENGHRIGEPSGPTATINVQQTRTARDAQKLFLPAGTWRVAGIPQLREGHNVGSYFMPGRGDAVIPFDVDASTRVVALRRTVRPPQYEFSDEVRRLADEIAANATTPRENAAVIERYLATRFEYLPNTEVSRPIDTETFLLQARRGHCEHFAAGMVLLLAARDVPARIAGGYYGGELNPLTGYFIVRQKDAHAWVEVWDGEAWLTYDPTPADLRPGADAPNFFLAYLTAVTDSVNFLWDRYILTFGLADQVTIVLHAIRGLRDALASFRGALAGNPPDGSLLLWAGLLFVIGIAAWLLITRVRFPRTTFDRLAASLRRSGITVRPEMTTAEILAAVEQLRPHLVPPVRTVVECYRRERFSPDGASTELSGAARNALRVIGLGPRR
jgi:protein-glutamine gamma-glutamyltransferase